MKKLRVFITSIFLAFFMASVVPVVTALPVVAAEGNSIVVVFSSLPKENEQGETIVTTWGYDATWRQWFNSPNLFDALIEEDGEITVTKDGYKIRWNPILKIGGVEQISAAPYLLAVDPVNSNYTNNTLRWDYGVATRDLRLIEGKLFEVYTFSINPNAEIEVVSNIIKDEGFIWDKEPFAYGADGKAVSISSDKVVLLEDLDNAAYPLVIDPSLDFTSSYDGYMWKSNANYFTARSAASGDAINDSSNTFAVGTSNEFSQYEIDRGGVFFNTASIPDGATISSVTMQLKPSVFYVGDGNFNIVIVDGSDLANPFIVSHYGDLLNDTTSHGSVNTSSMATDVYSDFALNAAGISDINDTGISQFGLRSSYDISGTAPSVDYYNVVYFYSNDKGVGFEPLLEVIYEPAPPTSLTAAINDSDQIDLSWSKGADAEETEIRYSTIGYPATYSSDTQAYRGTLSAVTVSALDPGTLYYFRAWSWDSAPAWSSGYSSNSEYTLPEDISSLVAAASSGTQIDLSWSKGAGGDITVVLRSASTYPVNPNPAHASNPGDTVSVYNGTASVASDTSLSVGTLYYYSAWSQDTDSGYYGENYVTDVEQTLDVPIVATVAASEQSVTTARLNANLTNDGGYSAATFMRFGYGTTESEYSQGADDSSIEINYADDRMAQTFTTSVSGYTIDAVGIKLYRVLSPTLITIDITATDGGGQPTGGVLSTGSITDASVTVTDDTGGEWYEVNMGNVVLSGSTKYAIIIYGTVDATNKLDWRSDDSSPSYGGGNVEESTDGGSSWITDATKDCVFIIWSAYTSTAWDGGHSTGENYNYVVTGLAFDTEYRFRAESYNGAGTGDGSSLLFRTTATLTDPTDLILNSISGESITVSWVKGFGSQLTRVLYKAGSYPTAYDDGSATEAYWDNGTSVLVEDLSGGTTYYFRIWGYAPAANWSSGYDENLITTATLISSSAIDAPYTSPYWFLNPDPSKLSRLPFYELINQSATDMGMPIGSLWLIMSLILAMAGGGVAFILTRSGLVTYLLMAVFTYGGSMAGITPLWILFVFSILAISALYLWPRMSYGG